MVNLIKNGIKIGNVPAGFLELYLFRRVFMGFHKNLKGSALTELLVSMVNLIGNVPDGVLELYGIP